MSDENISFREIENSKENMSLSSMGTITDSKDNPLISVIIDGFMRKEFIAEAVKSVHDQEIPKSHFEIIVLRAFDSPDVDRTLLENGAIILNSANMTIGQAIAEAIEISKGEIICFLDDDDLFLPNKLSKIEEIFKGDKELCYYHNGQTFCNSKSEPVLGFKFKKENPGYLKSDNSNFLLLNKTLKKIGYYIEAIWFNLSSITVRKKIFSGKMNIVRSITGHTDDLMFYLAFSYPDKISIINSDEHLTVYRVHNSTTNIVKQVDDATMINNRIKQYQDFASSSFVFMQMMRGTTCESYVSARYAYDLAFFYNTKKEGINMIKQTIRLALKENFKIVEFNSAVRIRVYLSLFVLAFFYIFSKRFSILKHLRSAFPNVESFRR